MKGSTFKRCGCSEIVHDEAGRPARDAGGKAKRRQLGADCPELRRPDGSWSPRHGRWYYLLEIPATAAGKREHVRQGGFASDTEAQKAMDEASRLISLADGTEDPDRVRREIAELVRVAIKARKPLPFYADVGRLLALADGTEEPARIRREIADLVRAAITAGEPLPPFEEVRKRCLTGQQLASTLTLSAYLAEWLESKKDIRPTTLRGYRIHVRRYLDPHLGKHRLDRLRAAHVQAMFTAIDEANEDIVAANAARRALERAAKTAFRERDWTTGRAARAKLRALPPYRRPVYAATQQRIRATLRSALSDAAPQDLVTVNVAKLVKLASGRAPKPLMWNEERVARWRKTGEKPSPVMVWNAEQTVAFLQRASRHRLYALYHLITFTGLRRGEACGLRWSDLDLTKGTLTVAQQIIQLGWATEVGRPKSDAGDRTIALAQETVTELKAHRARQKRERLAHGTGWLDTDLVFTAPDGSPLHPAEVTTQFFQLTREAGLPPIRLHDLRHGTATHARAAGIDIEVVKEMLGHSSSTLTRDTYTTVVEEAKHQAAATLAGLFTLPGTSPRTAAAD